MKRLIFTVAMLFGVAYGQTIGYLRYDTVKMAKNGGTTELVLENATKAVTGGVLTNTGNGRTAFVAASALGINEIDVYLIAGQSNAVGDGDAATSPTVIPGTVYQYNYSTGLTVGNDPIGTGSSQSQTGSAWPAFGVSYYTLTNRKICFVPAAISGSAQTAAATTSFGNWDTTGTHWDTSVARVQAAMTYLASNGYTPVFKGVLWCQGENDANAINSATITQAAYIAAFRKMIGRYRTAFGVRMPFYIFRTGTRTDASDVGYLSVRDAQNTVSNADSITNIVFWNAINFPSRGLMADVYHYTQAGYNEMGRIGAEEVLNSGSTRFQTQANNLYFNKGNIGIGNTTSAGIPANKLFIDNGTTGSGPIYTTTNTNTANGRIKIENTNSGSSALTPIGFYNNSGIGGQIGLGSSTYGFGANKMFVQGILGATVISALSDIEFAQNTGLVTYARFTSNGNFGLNTATPDSNLTVELGILGKRGVRFSGLPTTAQAYVGMFDAAGNMHRVDTTGLFGGSGSGANTALSNLASVAINTDFNVNNQLLYGNSNAYNVQTGTTYTLDATDNGKIVTLDNGSGITLTVPTGLPAGFNCTIVQLGAGVVTITPSSTTVNNRQSFTQTGGQFAAVTILQYTTNTFISQGDMQ